MKAGDLRAMMKRFLLGLLLATAPGWAADTVWTFANEADRLSPATGSGTLDYWDPNGDGWGPVRTAFGTASGFGLPALPGGDAAVMQFPTCTAQQGYVVTHGGSPNGAYGETDGLISNYTVIFDILYPAANDGLWRALWQTDASNGQDAEFYVRNVPSGGIGINGNYHGRILPNTWHRVAIVVRAAPGEGYFQRYVDGQFVGGYGSTGSAADIRFAAGPELLLFTDDGGETAGGFLSSLRMVDRALSMAEVEALGGPHASGAAVAGAPAPAYDTLMPRRVQAIGHRGGAFGKAPDNTLAAVQTAIADGIPVIEIDTRLSADGECILLHDATVDRTTNGTGEASAMTLAELKALDAGSWFDPSFAGQRIPTVAEVMALAKGKLILYFDLKVTGQITAIQEAATATGFSLSDCWFWVYDDATEAATIRAAVPDAAIVWGDPPADWASDPDYFSGLRDLGVRVFDLATYYGTADATFTLAAKQAGFLVSCYTVLDPPTMIANAAAGVDYMETDYGHILNALQPPQLGQSSRPQPADGASEVPATLTLSWVPGTGATAHRIYFGTTAPGALVGEQSHDLFPRTALAPGTTYYWRVDTVTESGVVAGDVWRFSTPAATGLAEVREWTFDGGNLNAALGSGVLAYASAATEGLTTFGTTDGATVPHVGGQPASYMAVPAFTEKSDGYWLTFPDLGPNGGGAFINQYTVIMDVLVPGGINWLPFFQSNPGNPVGNDADFYLNPNGSLGIGELGYSPAGLFQSGQWHRVAFVADLGAGAVDIYLDGAPIRQRRGGSLRDGRFSMPSNVQAGADLLLFNENYGDGTNYTLDLLVAGIAFVSKPMVGSEVAALGAPQAPGIFVSSPGPLPVLSIAYATPDIVLTWAAQPGVRLQRSATLATASWSEVPGTEGTGSHREAVIPGGIRFFRLAR
jgi:glycerophosphoryl diester phosphodiesterase